MTMTLDSVAKLTDQLRQHRLLELPQLKEVEENLQRRYDDPRALAQDLLKRGWLTPYQINLLFQGRIEELVLGQYVVLERLGEGATGQVFKARHGRMKRLAALKVIRPELLSQEEAVGRFYREIQAMSRLSSPHIVEAYDAGPVNRTHFFAMEYVEGIDLDRLVKQNGPLTVEQACGSIRQAALGLQHAHENGLVHRDIKPSNLMVSRVRSRGSKAGLVKVLDMGLVHLCSARKVNGRNVTTFTEQGTIIGTPDFMSPEQVDSPHKVDIRADIYSLGCSLYFLLSGQICFPGCNLFQKILKIQQAEPTPLEQLRPKLPKGLAPLVRRMMAKRPEDRPQTPGEVAIALLPYIGKQPQGTAVNRKNRETCDAIQLPSQTRLLHPPTTGFPGPRPRARGVLRSLVPGWRGWLFLSTMSAVLLVGGAIFLLAGAVSGPPTPEDLAEKALKPLLAQAADASGDQDALRARLIDLRVAHPGTPAAQKAALALMKLPSALDRLDVKNLARDERLAWEAKELVGLFNPPPPAAGDRLAFSTTAQRVACLSKENGLQVWDLASGQLQGTIRPTGWVANFAISPNGHKVVTATSTGKLQLWDVASGMAGLPLPGHSDALLMATFDERGQWLATSSSDMTVKIWDTATGRQRGTLSGYRKPARALAFTPDGVNIAMGTDAGDFKLWDIVNGKEGPGGVHGSQPMRLLAFSPDGKRMVSVATGDPVVKVWNTGNAAERHQLTGHRTAPHTVAFSADSQVLATASQDHTVRFWDLLTGEEKPGLANLDSTVQVLAFSADGKTLSTWHQDQTLRQWDTATLKPRGLLRGPASWQRTVAIAPDGQRLATGSLAGTLSIWDSATAKARNTLLAHGGIITDLAFAPDNRLLASASTDRTVKLIDLGSGQVKTTLSGHTAPIASVAFTPDAKVLASAGTDGAIKLWDVAQGKERSTLRSPAAVRALAFTPDGQTLFGAGEDGMVRAWNWGGTRETASVKAGPGGLRSLALAPFGQQLATGAEEGSALQLWDTGPTPPQFTRPLQGHAGPVNALAFSPDAQSLATAGEDGKVIVWQLEGNQKQREWTLPGPVLDLAFAPDGRHIAFVNSTGTCGVLRLAP